MAASVIDGALGHPPVVFALYGHPLVFAYPPFQLYQAAMALKLQVKTLPGISAFDSLLVQLRIDPSVQGIQMYEATDLLVRRRPLQPDVPCFVWQIGSLETVIFSKAKSKPERFHRFRNYILNFYPSNHEVIVLHVSDSRAHPPQVIAFPIGEIAAYAEDLHQGMTLYIPPLAPRGVQDQELADKLTSLQHLKMISFHV
jgi:uncharacterized protein YabN with tetrapyrrole methylase and pyrophosphatase domain